MKAKPTNKMLKPKENKLGPSEVKALNYREFLLAEVCRIFRVDPRKLPQVKHGSK